MADVPEEIREFFRKLAKAGGYPKKGGDARAAALTPAERSAAAKKAAKARWGARKTAEKKAAKKAAKPIDK